MIPAVVHDLRYRGVLREGAAADLVVFDPSRLRCTGTRLVKDFPAGAGRYVVGAEGYVASWTVTRGDVKAKEHKSKAPGSGSRRPALPALVSLRLER